MSRSATTSPTRAPYARPAIDVKRLIADAPRDEVAISGWLHRLGADERVALWDAASKAAKATGQIAALHRAERLCGRVRASVLFLRERESGRG